MPLNLQPGITLCKIHKTAVVKFELGCGMIKELVIVQTYLRCAVSGV